MPRSVALHPSERVDIDDLDGVSQYAGGMVAEFGKLVVVDRQCRVLRGFRVELANQDLYPGRITIHGGAALRPDGQTVFNEDDLGVSRTITLEGASTTFFVEIEYLEADAGMDGRAFWDPTVPQENQPSGDPSPSGQEFTVNVPTRKIRDWRISQPVRTGSQGFERDQFGSTSNKIPILKITTDASNKITTSVNAGLTAEKAATVLLQQVTATQIIVQDPVCLPAAGAQLVVGEGEANVETVSIISIDRATGTVVITSLANTHTPGQIVRGGSVTADYLTDTEYGRYRRVQAGVTTYDFRDRMWQGDEVHGSILKRGFGTVRSATDRNVQDLKDYVDFLSGQVQEMKWGVADPYMGARDDLRIPPEMVGTVLPATPRHYDRTGALVAAHAPTIVIGDGVNSFGDINGQTDEVFQKAHDKLLGGAGVVLVKPGDYTLTTDVVIVSNVIFRGWCGHDESPDKVKINIKDGSFAVSVGSIDQWVGGFENINFASPDEATVFDAVALLTTGSDVPPILYLKNCQFTDCCFVNNTPMSGRSVIQDCAWESTGGGWLNGRSLVTCPDDIGSVLAGTWQRCKFFARDTDEGSNCVGNGASGGIPLKARMGAINWDTCTFQASGANVSVAVFIVSQGDTYFDKCILVGYQSNTFFKACLATMNSLDLVVTNCFLVDRALACGGSIGITVSGCRSILTGTTTNNGPIVLQNCSHVLVEGCLLEGVSATGQMLAGCIEFRGTNGWIGEDIVFCNNTIQGLNTNSTGILITTTGIGNISSFNIYGNHVMDCQVGIAFNGDAAFILNDCMVNGNQIVDFGVSIFEGSRMICGILVDSNIACGNWTINNNMVAGANVRSSTLLNGVAVRAGIFVQSGMNGAIDFVISNNSIRNCGVAGYDAAGAGLESYGIKINWINGAVVSNNVINGIAANNQKAVGIGAGMDAVNATYNCQVNNNMIVGVGTFGNPYGILLGPTGAVGTLHSYCCVGNTIKGTNGLLHRCIGVEVDNAYDLNISSNSIHMENSIASGNDGSAIWVAVPNQLMDVVVNGNMIRGTGSFASMYTGIGVGCFGDMRSVSVTGNTIYNMSTYTAIPCPGIIVLGTNGGEGVSITGNSIQQMYAPGIMATSLNDLTISGNTVIDYNITQFVSPYCGHIHVGACNYFSVTGNLVSGGNALTLPHIAITGGSSRGIVSANILEGGGVQTGASIRTDSAESTEHGIIVFGNVGPALELMGATHVGTADFAILRYPDGARNNPPG
jgi:hypothetical protein